MEDQTELLAVSRGAYHAAGERSQPGAHGCDRGAPSGATRGNGFVGSVAQREVRGGVPARRREHEPSSRGHRRLPELLQRHDAGAGRPLARKTASNFLSSTTLSIAR